MEKVLHEQEPKADWGLVFLAFFLPGVIGWGVTDMLFEHALLSICGGVIAACLFGWPALHAGMKNWGDKN